MENILIVGLGLIGASYAKGLTKKGYKVYGCDLDEETNSFAVSSGFVCAASENPCDYIEQVDTIIIGLYPKDIVPFLLKYQKYFNENQVITDVCGVKSSVCAAATQAALPAKFVGSHPMAGREKIGIKFADEKIFTGTNFLICPLKETDEMAIKVVEEIASALEFGYIHHITPEHHDHMIAYTSQLTHAIAVCLVNSESSVDVSKFIGDSYRDLTRIAMINEKLWSELFFDNKDALIQEIESFEKEIEKLKMALLGQKKDELKDLFVASRKKREVM